MIDFGIAKCSSLAGALTGRESGLADFATETFDVSTTSFCQNHWWHTADFSLPVSSLHHYFSLFFHRVGRDIMTSLHFGELLARKLPLDAEFGLKYSNLRPA